MNLHEDEREESRCGDCKHWHALPSDPMNLAAPRVGMCRAVPPQGIVVGYEQTARGTGVRIDFRYPQLLADNFGCGMYQEKLQISVTN